LTNKYEKRYTIKIASTKFRTIETNSRFFPVKKND